MRHRKKGRVLGRSPSHRKALLRNLASALFLTERDAELDDNEPKVKGRITTTLHKAKEVRPLVEKCITIARRSLQHQREAEQYATDAERGTEAWKSWRQSEEWQKWNHAISPAVAARRRALTLLGDKKAVQVLFEDVAPRFEDRDGGYTRVLKLATPRVGDAGARAVLEFVGTHDRVAQKSERPTFEDEGDEEPDTLTTDGADAASDDADRTADETPDETPDETRDEDSSEPRAEQNESSDESSGESADEGGEAEEKKEP